ncbi:MAG: hypothetical protein K2X27_28700 [Candidatus Obscuribacterales bacterium]|nr:hypothetical protein [Candidatus Obscuribacterales bacterium]
MYVRAKQDNQKALPGLSIGDKSVEDSGWVLSDGWNGLFPGESSIEEAKLMLGEISGISELANGITYDFKDGKVRVSFLDGNPYISKIWIDSSAEAPFDPPETIDDALRTYGKMVATAVNRYEGVIFERPNMRICCDAMSDSNPLRWMEIYVDRD